MYVAIAIAPYNCACVHLITRVGRFVDALFDVVVVVAVFITVVRLYSTICARTICAPLERIMDYVWLLCVVINVE